MTLLSKILLTAAILFVLEIFGINVLDDTSIGNSKYYPIISGILFFTTLSTLFVSVILLIWI